MSESVDEDFRDEFTKALDNAARAALKSLADDGVELSEGEVVEIGFGIVSVISVATAASRQRAGVKKEGE